MSLVGLVNNTTSFFSTNRQVAILELRIVNSSSKIDLYLSLDYEEWGAWSSTKTYKYNGDKLHDTRENWISY